jgi:hypothetical protein
MQQIHESQLPLLSSYMSVLIVCAPSLFSASLSLSQTLSLSSLLFARLSQANNTLTPTFATVSSSGKRKCVLGEERTFTPLFQHTRKKSGVVGLVGSGVSGHAVMGGGGKHDGGGVFLAACWTLYLVYEYIYIRMRVCVCVYVRMRACV